MGRKRFSLAVILFLTAAVLASPAFSADDPFTDEQFIALGSARTRADLAVRKLKLFFDKNDNSWRSAGTALDNRHAQTLEALRRLAEDETKKPDELRDPAALDALAQRRADLEQQWQQFAAVDRPALLAEYTAAAAANVPLAQALAGVTQMEAGWKDAHLNLPVLQANYDAIAHRADDCRAAAQHALEGLQSAGKTWGGIYAATTRPGLDSASTRPG